MSQSIVYDWVDSAMTAWAKLDQRYYTSQFGRFMSADRSKAASTVDSGSWNRYSYTENDPVNYYDPSGQSRCSPDGPCDDSTDGPGGIGWPVLPPCTEVQRVHADCSGSPRGGGGGSPTALEQFDSLSTDCQQGLLAAVNTGSADPESAAAARLAALARANASASVLQRAAGDGVDWTWLAAIGIEETLFKNIDQLHGPGQGVFQITVSPQSGVTSSQAHNLAWAASWVANYLLGNEGSLRNSQGLSGDALAIAVFDSYNAGLGGVNRALDNGRTADSASANGHYGTTALQLTKCF